MSNINELLYMARMKDETAIQILMDEMKPRIRCDIRQIIGVYQPLRGYEEDFMQEGGICLFTAMETFREDRRCSFPTYLAIIVKRRIWALVRKLNHSHSQGFNMTIALDQPYAEEEGLLSLLENTDRLGDPEYYLHFTIALENLNDLREVFRDRDHDIYDAWTKGDRYEVSRQRLGLSYKQYEGRLRRLRNKVRTVVRTA